MCGACGREVVPDAVLGSMRTLRQHLVVAHVINAVCCRVPGAPRVAALIDGWLITESTGKTRLCRTVEDTWIAVIDSGFDTASHLDRLTDELVAQAGDLASDGLSARVSDAGQALVTRSRDSIAPRH